MTIGVPVTVMGDSPERKTIRFDSMPEPIRFTTANSQYLLSELCLMSFQWFHCWIRNCFNGYSSSV